MHINKNKPSKRKINFINYKKPFPNLSKCYKYNEAACCTILHDSAIEDYTNAILPSSCLRKYTELEDLLCVGCSPLESKYLTSNSTAEVEKDGTNITVPAYKLNICKKFAYKLWNATSDDDLNNPTSRFDNCMFKFGDGFEPDGCDFDNKSFVIPSSCFNNFKEFVQKISIPYYYISSVEIDESNDPEKCFSDGYYISFSKFLAVICVILLNFY